ncbi:MerR family transcriptional regulator [Kitasatospora sp. NPDC006697]|uniref:MerR family transcriptional regulator n=1 Tax=Kitasatospora sp. NPDC006697 TaxID=3364020 RepID=UPI00368C1034
MDGDTWYSIGDLARLAGVTVKTVRFYSDRGLLAPAGRNPAGHRRYRAEDLDRLELVRTLRDLGLDLATVRRVLERELSPARVAAEHAAALEVQLRVLRLRQAVLVMAAERASSLEELGTMNKLARLAAEERRQLIEEFLDEALGGLAERPEYRGVARSLTPELPEGCTEAQLRAWVELAELSREPGFRAALRAMVERHARESTARGAGDGRPRPDLVAAVRRIAEAGTGLDPGAAAAGPTAEALRAAGASSPEALESAYDPRLARYLSLLAVVNEWPAPVDPRPALAWAAAVLRAHPA